MRRGILKENGTVGSNAHFHVAARGQSIDRNDHVLNFLSDSWPRGAHYHDDSDLTLSQILLIAQVLICRDQNAESRLLGSGEQIPVCQFGPSHLGSGIHRPRMKVTPQWNRGPLVEQDLHAAATGSRLAAAKSRTASTWSLVTPGNHSTNSSTVAPSSRFSKSALTGTRVPRNSHAPLTFP